MIRSNAGMTYRHKLWAVAREVKPLFEANLFEAVPVHPPSVGGSVFRKSSLCRLYYTALHNLAQPDIDESILFSV